MMIRCLVLTAAIAGAMAQSVAAQAPGPAPGQAGAVRIEDAWIRPPAPSRDVTGGYLTLINESDQPARLVAGTSTGAGTIELHEMAMDGDVMRMRPVKEIVVPARGRTSLRPGGLHLMLFGVATPLEVGVVVPLQLRFADGRIVTVDAVVRQPEAPR